MTTPYEPKTPKEAYNALQDRRDVLAEIHERIKQRQKRGVSLTSENVFAAKGPQTRYNLSEEKEGEPILFVGYGIDVQLRVTVISYPNPNKIYSWQSATRETAIVRTFIRGKETACVSISRYPDLWEAFTRASIPLAPEPKSRGC